MRNHLVKKLIRQIHLWLGLSSGLVVFIVSVTGCIYVFQEEICLLLQSGVFRSIETQDADFITPMELQQTVEDAFGKPITYMNATVYPAGNRGTIVWLRDGSRDYTAFVVNPYSGQIIDTFPYRLSFWSIVLVMHTSLLIPNIGHHIVAAATLIFVVLLITGIILWFPKNKKGYKQRFKVKWNASPKRLNYDLHNVLGFYMTWVAIFLAISGLVMSYQWLDKGIYWLATGGEWPTESTVQKMEEPATEKYANTGMIDRTFQDLLQATPELSSYFIEFPYDTTGNYSLTTYADRGKFYNKHDTWYISQHSGQLISSERWKDKNAGEVIQEANYNIHVGAILGLPGKIIAFLASLIAASLPITGFYIWWGRNWGKKRRKRSPKSKNQPEILHSG